MKTALPHRTKGPKTIFPHPLQGGVAKTKKTSKQTKKQKYKKKHKKNNIQRVLAGTPLSRESGFLLFFRCFFWVLPLPLADAWGKIVFVLMVVQFLFLWSFFLVRWECSLCSQIGAYLSEKLDSQGLPFCCFFWGALPHILVYRGRLYLPYYCISRR